MSNNSVSNIGRQDVIWNYAATFLHIGAGIILLPFILKMLPSETVGIWQIFSTIIMFTALLDVGFNPSFTRNVTYIFSGVTSLRKKGISALSENSSIDYSLLKGTISAMKWFYLRMSILLLIILLTAGTFYIYHILETYSLSKVEIYISWIILCVLNTYNLYTLYYDSLVQGKGLVKKSKQIRIIGQIVYLSIAIIFIYLGFGLIAIVSAQVLSLIVKRILSHRIFFTKYLKEKLKEVEGRNVQEIISAIYPNALKLGITAIGGFLISQSSIIIAPEYMSLSEVASYGTTMQIIGIITSIAAVYINSYTPKLFQHRAELNTPKLRILYKRSCIILFTFVLIGGSVFTVLGEPVLDLIKSNTQVLGQSMIIVALIIAYLEKNTGMAGLFLLSKNEVPFFKASIISGICTVALLVIFLKYFNLGMWGLILAPGIVQLCYQNWKWPLEVIKDLKS